MGSFLLRGCITNGYGKDLPLSRAYQLTPKEWRNSSLEELRAAATEATAPFREKQSALEERYAEQDVVFRELLQPVFAKPAGDYAALQWGPVLARATSASAQADLVDAEGGRVAFLQIALLPEDAPAVPGQAGVLAGKYPLQDISDRHVSLRVGPWQLMFTVNSEEGWGQEKVTVLLAAVTDLGKLPEVPVSAQGDGAPPEIKPNRRD